MNNHEPENYKCPFCRILNSEIEAKNEIITETKNAFVCLSLEHFPASGPSVLVIPKKHVENLYDINNSLLSEIICLGRDVAIFMKSLWNLDGITLWQHNEPAGSQDVWHFHLHVKGRRENDNLYRSNKVKTPQEQRAIWASELRQAIEGSHNRSI